MPCSPSDRACMESGGQSGTSSGGRGSPTPSGSTVSRGRGPAASSVLVPFQVPSHTLACICEAGTRLGERA